MQSRYFCTTKQDSHTKARIGSYTINNQTVATPVFMPVATLGAVRLMDFERLAAIGYRIVLSNSYHLYLRPGIEVVRQFDGLHKFINWPHSILTDSGGYQVFSLNKFININDYFIETKSHLDGSTHILTPEKVIQIQLDLGSDIIMPLDHCTPPDIPKSQAADALERSIEWLKRSVRFFAEHPAAKSKQLFAIVQGNFFKELRKYSIQQMAALDIDGIAIGGLSVGEQPEIFYDIIEYMSELLPVERPKYIMGIGTPRFIIAAISCGYDMFDCVYPTRVARHGLALTLDGKKNVKNSRYRMQDAPIDSECECNCCKKYSASYIHHLFRCKEFMAISLLCEHNLYFMHHLITLAHQSIATDSFHELQSKIESSYPSV